MTAQDWASAYGIDPSDPIMRSMFGNVRAPSMWDRLQVPMASLGGAMMALGSNLPAGRLQASQMLSQIPENQSRVSLQNSFGAKSALEAANMLQNMKAMAQYRQAIQDQYGTPSTGRPTGDTGTAIQQGGGMFQPGAGPQPEGQNQPQPQGMFSPGQAPQGDNAPQQGAISPAKAMARNMMRQATLIMPVNPDAGSKLMEQAIKMDPEVAIEMHAANQGMVRGPGGFSNAPGYVQAGAEKESANAMAKVPADVIGKELSPYELAPGAQRYPANLGGLSQIMGGTGQGAPAPNRPVAVNTTPPNSMTATINNNAQEPYLVENAKLLAQNKREWLTNAKEAQRSDALLNTMETAMKSMAARGDKTGYFTPALAQATAMAKSVGIDPSAVIGMSPESVGDAQTAQKSSKILFGEVLKRMFPQRITNVDMKVMEGIAPGIGLDPQANVNLIKSLRNQNQYDKNLANQALSYEQKNNHLYGFEKGFYEQNGYGPLGALMDNSSGQSAAPAKSAAPSLPKVGDVIDGYEYKGGDPKNPRSWKKSQ